MSYPSVKTIKSIEWLDKVGDPTAIAKQIRKVMECFHHDWLLEHVLSNLSLDLPNHMYRSSLLHLQLWTIDRLLDCHGLEMIGSTSDGLEYCNTGDTYMSTVGYDYKKGKFVVTSYGDWVERNDPNGTKY
jgi:hypothetical protein